MRGNSGYCISLQTNARVFSTKCSNSSETRYIEQRTGKQARCGPHTLCGLSQAARLPLSLSNLLKDSFVWVLILNQDSIYIILTVTARAQSSWDRRYGVFNESGVITVSHQDESEGIVQDKSEGIVLSAWQQGETAVSEPRVFLWDYKAFWAFGNRGK